MPLVPPSGGRARAMELVSRLVTRETIVDVGGLVTVGSSGLALAGETDLALVVALDRFGSGESFLGLLGGYGLRRGACATSITWDTTDVVVVAKDEDSLRTALRRLEELGGGAVFAVGQEVVAELPAPIYSVISPEPLPVVVRQLADVERALAENGVPWERPLPELGHAHHGGHSPPADQPPRLRPSQGRGGTGLGGLTGGAAARTSPACARMNSSVWVKMRSLSWSMVATW